MSGGGSQSWEFSKENIQPIRGGRSVAQIDEALHCSSDVLRSERQYDFASAILFSLFTRSLALQTFRGKAQVE
jgi:hypothetical protein